MQKIRKFKTVEDKINVGLKIMCAFLLVGIIIVGKSYAEYKQETEVTFINAKVGSFTANDIELSMKVDNEEVSTPPSKDNYTVEVKCDNADGEWNIEEWGADIRNIKSNKVKCEVNFKTPEPTISEVTATSEKTSINLSYESKGINVRTICKWGTSEGEYPNEVEGTNTECNINNLEMDTKYYFQVCAKNNAGEVCNNGSIKTRPDTTIAELVELGDYIKMTPTSTSYTLPNELSGCTGVSSTCIQNEINPSELNIWRVIRKNEDGTVEVVSEYVSSQKVYFYGKSGYINYIKGLNEVASQYTNEKYVAKTRHMGYSNLTETITNTSKFNQTTAPWTKNTSAQWTGCNANSYLCGKDESLGAGDIGYETDYNLVNSIYRNMIGYTKDKTATVYYLASRIFNYYGTTAWGFDSRLAMNDGTLTSQHLYYYVNVFYTHPPLYAVRPILTFKSDVQIVSGDGKSVETAYQFE